MMKIFIMLFLLSISLFASIGTISMLKGKATITRAGDAQKANTGDMIEEGDTINTFTKSRMQIILNDDTITTFGQNTEYTFDSYDANDDPHANMTLTRGFLRTITGRIGKVAPTRFTLRTKNSTIGIRGTGWITYVNENVENTLCFKGAITIETADETFDLPAGNMLLMSDGVFKKYEADKDFFYSEVKRIEKTVKNDTPEIGDMDFLNLDDTDKKKIKTTKTKNVLKKNETMRISVVGQGVASGFSSSPAQAYGMAKRAAIVDAYRMIAEKVKGVYVEGQDTIKNMMIKRSNLKLRVLAIVQNADIVDTSFKDGVCEVEMEVVLNHSQFSR